MFGALMSTTIKSARKPSFSRPQSSLPCPSAPPLVAAYKVSVGVTACGSRYIIFEAIANTFISSKKFRLLLLATLSVPIATLMPRRRSSGTLQTPLASFMLLTGFDATVTFFSFNMSKSSPSIQTQCAAVAGKSSAPRLAKY